MSSSGPRTAPGSREACVDTQRRLVGRLAFRWWITVDDVFGRVEGRSPAAARSWLRALERARDRAVRAGCPDPPPEMAEVLRLSAASPELSLRDVARLIPQLRAWSDMVGSSALSTYLMKQTYCLEHRTSLARATYVVRSVPTADGKDMWLDLTVENLTSRRIRGGVDGHLRVVGALPGTERRVSWGGSSADDVGVPPHSTSHKLLLSVVGDRFHVAADGHLTDIVVSIWVGAGPQIWCTLPARPTR